MDESRFHELEIKLEANNQLLQKVNESQTRLRDGQDKITQALLGGFDKDSVGLIEETRNLRREVNALTARSNAQESELSLLNAFKSDAKKVVAMIAFAIPFLFEVVKSLASLGWEYIKKP